MVVSTEPVKSTSECSANIIGNEFFRFAVESPTMLKTLDSYCTRPVQLAPFRCFASMTWIICNNSAGRVALLAPSTSHFPRSDRRRCPGITRRSGKTICMCVCVWVTLKCAACVCETILRVFEIHLPVLKQYAIHNITLYLPVRTFLTWSSTWLY